MLFEVLSKRPVHALGIVKNLCHVWRQQDDIGALHVPLVILSPHSARSRGLLADFIRISLTLTHIRASFGCRPETRRDDPKPIISFGVRHKMVTHSRGPRRGLRRSWKR